MDNINEIQYEKADWEYRAELEREIQEWENRLAEETRIVESQVKEEGITEDEIKELLFRPCETREELRKWVKFFLKLDLPDGIVDPDSNCSPLDMIWLLYRTAVHYDKISEDERTLKSVFYCSRGSFKCVSKDTYIMTIDGLKQIGNIIKEKGQYDISMLVHGEGRFREATKFLADGKKEIIKISTELGYEIKGTPKHPIKVLRDGEIQFVKLPDIKTSDWAVLEKGQNYYANKDEIIIEDYSKSNDYNRVNYTLPNKLTPDLSYIIGLLIGDGCLTIDGSIILSCADESVYYKYERIMKELFGNNISIKRKKNKNIDYVIHSVEVYDYFVYSLGLTNHKSLDKKIPEIILKASKDNQLAFINGYFDSDGFITKKGCAIFNSASKELLIQLKYMLMNMGYITEYYTYFNEKYGKNYYRLTLAARESYHLFKDVDIHKANYDCKSRLRNIRSFNDRIPLDTNLILKIKEIKDFLISKDRIRSRGNFKWIYNVQKGYCNSIYKDKLIKLVESFDDIPYREYLLNLVKYNYVIIKSIDKCEDEEVFDFYIPDEHLFWSNGFISHNSLTACAAEFAIMLHSGRNTVHIGLIQKQASNAYNSYFRPFLQLPYIKDWVVKSTTLGDTEIYNRFNEVTKLQVIPLTMNKTSSPRAQLVCKDEIDKVAGEQVLAYQNAYGMLTATNDGKLPMEFDISSRDSSSGMVQEIIDSSDRTGCKVYHWNRIDITEKCSDERSGKVPTPIYIRKEKLFHISEDEFLMLPSDEQKNYELHWGLDGCVKCPIFAACKGYLKNQSSKSKWLKPIVDTIKAIQSAPSEDMVIAQLLCRIPPKTGLVYSDFDKRKNVKTPSELYEIWTGKPIRKDLTTNDLIDLMIDSDEIDLVAGSDAGYHHPAALLLGIDLNHNIYVLKEYMPTEEDSQDFAHNLKERWGHYPINIFFPDVESPDLISALKKNGFRVSKKVDKNRQNGIATVKGFVRPPGTNTTKLYVNGECRGLIYEIGKWSYKQNPDGSYSDDAEKKNDHACDALRYPIHTLFGKNKANLIGKNKKDNERDAKEIIDQIQKTEEEKMIKERLNPLRIASAQGLRVIDNRETDSKDGKKKKKKKRLTGLDYTKF